MKTYTKILTWLLLLAMFTLSGAPAKKQTKKKPIPPKKKITKVVAEKTPAGWLTNPKEAMDQAAKTKRPILVLASGPSWNKPCATLHKKMIESQNFKNNIAKNVVLLYVGVPKGGISKVKNFKALFPFIKGGELPILAVANADLKSGTTITRRTIFQIERAIVKLKEDAAKKNK